MQLLKKDWERFANPVHLDLKMAAHLLAPFTHEPIRALTLLSNGCVNSNYKVEFQSQIPAVVLRVYVREKDALAREMILQRLINHALPIANILYNDSTQVIYPHPYAVMEWVEGELMRDVILQFDETAIAECAYAAGELLEKLTHFRFATKGFFNNDLSVRAFKPYEEYLSFTHKCLNDTMIFKHLGADLTIALQDYIYKNKYLLDMPTNAHLTHADFDATNMLVEKVDGHYKIAALLDWEFAFSDSYFLDMGIFLRFSKRLPACFEEAFIQGFESTGLQLPEYWRELTHLMDILCMLSMLYDNRHIERPLMKQDVKRLLAAIIDDKSP